MSRQEYARKYADVKRKMHVMTYGTAEYKSMRALMNYYYHKLNG